MQPTRVLLAAAFALAVAAPAAAQAPAAPSAADVQAVMVPIDQLFAGMKARDTTMIVGAFVPTGRLISVGNRNGETQVRALPPADFAASLTRAPAGDLIERYWDAKVDIEDNVANVWVQYDFHIGEKFSHCGIDAIQLAKTHAGWKIVQIMDTRRTTNCGKPPAK